MPLKCPHLHRLPKNSAKINYEFLGFKDLSNRCSRFLKDMEQALTEHPAWSRCNEAKMAKARDGIEKYIMEKLCDIALNHSTESSEWKSQDEILNRRMQILSVRAIPTGLVSYQIVCYPRHARYQPMYA